MSNDFMNEFINDLIITYIFYCLVLIYLIYIIKIAYHITNIIIIFMKNNIYYVIYNSIKHNNLYFFYSINVIYKNDSKLYCYECLICFELYNDKNIHLTNCNHEYCKYCFIKLLKFSYDKNYIHCPYCRDKINCVFITQ